MGHIGNGIVNHAHEGEPSARRCHLLWKASKEALLAVLGPHAVIVGLRVEKDKVMDEAGGEGLTRLMGKPCLTLEAN